jgi:hypothetical protein
MLYDSLVERDVDAFVAATRELTEEDLWIAVARFAVLAYSPSQHSKRSVMAVRAAHDIRGDRYRDLIIECARYAAESRQPWTEPPIFDEMEIPPVDELQAKVTGDAALMLDTALALEPLLGEKGRAALLRMPLMEMQANPEPEVVESLDVSIARAINEKGSIDSVRAVFIAALVSPLPATRGEGPPFAPYRLARDYAQTLIAHAFAPRIPFDTTAFLAAVHENLEHGDSYAEWTLA